MICGIIAQRVVPGSGITSDDTISVNEGVSLAHTLTAGDFVEWSIVGGADAARFSISGSTLHWLSNGTQDYEDPLDANADNVYEVTVRATNLGGGTDDQTISVTVLDTGAGSGLLDTLSQEPTSAFSLSRDLIGAYEGGSFYALTGGTISQVDDQTGAGRHLVQVGSSARPSIAVAGPNGRACAVFDGVADVMTGESYALLFEPTAFYVVISGIVTSVGTNDSIVLQNDALWTDNGQNTGVFLKSATPSIHACAGTEAGPFSSTTHTLTLGQPFVFEMRRNGSALQSRLNGGAWENGTITLSSPTPTTAVFRIGANDAPEQFSNCSIFELVTYDAVLTGAEEDAIAANMFAYVAGEEGEAAGVAAGAGAATAIGESYTNVLWTPEYGDLEAVATLWFDASEAATVTESAGAVSQWNDKAQGLHVTQSTSGSKPTYVAGTAEVLNGLNTIAFDGVDDFLAKTIGLGDNVPFIQTTFFVGTPSGEGTSVYWTTNGSAIRGNIELSFSNLRYQGSSANHTNYNPSDQWHVHSGYIGGGAARTLYVDGTLRDTNGSGVDTGTPLPTQIYFGSAGGDSYFAGSLGELVQYDGLLSSAERQQVEGYLAHKWGLEALLPAEHPYKTDPPYTSGLISLAVGAASGTGVAAAAGAGLGTVAAVGAAAGISAAAAVGSSTIVGPHRYWRIFAETNNGDANFIGISEIEFHEDSFSGANVLTGGTITASSQASGTYVPGEAIDGVYHVTADDRWASNSTGGTNEWIKYDFGASNDKEINSIIMWSLSSSTFNQSIKDFRVEYSDDDSAWTTLWTDTFTCTGNQQWIRSTATGHETPANTSQPYGTHTYWRCYIQTGNGALSCAEMEMRATPGGADQCTGGTPSVLSSVVGSASSIFDNNNSTHWAQNGGVNWIKYQFASPVSVAEIAWRIRGDSNPTHSPNDFIIQFSDDNATWATAWFVINQASWTNGEQRVFTSPDYV